MDEPQSMSRTPERMELPTLAKGNEFKLSFGLVLQILAGMAFGAWASYQLLRGGFSIAPAGTEKSWVLLLVVIAFVLALALNLALHELGHAFAGRVMGGTVLRVILGPFRYELFRSGFRWRKVRSLRGVGGFVQTVLPADGRLRAAMTVMLLGGPLANLLLAACAFVIARVPGVHYAVRLSCVEIATFGVILGLINLVPFRTQGFLTDGAQLWRLWMHPETLERTALTARIARSSIDGRRPRELDPADIEALDPSRSSGNERFVALLLRASVAADKGDLRAERTAIEAALADWEHLPDGFRQHLALSAANSCAQLDRDPVRAREWLARAEGGLIEEYQYAEVRARIANLEVDPITRDSSIEQMRRGIEDSIYLGDAKLVREKLARWDQHRVL